MRQDKIQPYPREQLPGEDEVYSCLTDLASFVFFNEEKPSRDIELPTLAANTGGMAIFHSTSEIKVCPRDMETKTERGVPGTPR